MQIRISLGCILVGCAFLLGACQKYREANPVPDAAYIRVFNDINNTVDFLHSTQAPPFMTFIMDPRMDASGAPDTGAIVGDFLGTRQLFSLSYPINEGNSLGTTTITIGAPGSGSVVQQNINYEYPGNAHVLTAPAINGFDLSSWAQVPSGKHRFIFVLRPQTDTSFTRLSETIRKGILIDTTIDLQAGEVYTLEALSTDLDNNKYGMYVRQEQFIHQAFEQNQLYVGFVNLGGVPPAAAQGGYFTDFSDSTVIYYSYLVRDDIRSGAPGGYGQQIFNPLSGYNNNYFTTLNGRMNTQISYLGLPLLSRSYFFLQDTLRSYAQNLNLGINYAFPGTLPYVQFTFYNQDSLAYSQFDRPFVLSCNADPVTFNNYQPGVALNNAPNLDLITNVGGTVNIYPTLNIMEMVYDRIYMTQIQYGFNQVPNN